MIIAKCVRILGLERPFDIQIKSRRHKSMDAAYWGLRTESGKLQSHLIRVYLGNEESRSLDTLIAHELIHAWQEENKLKEIHGVTFRYWAEKLEYIFGLEGIYIPGTDE